MVEIEGICQATVIKGSSPVGETEIEAISLKLETWPFGDIWEHPNQRIYAADLEIPTKFSETLKSLQSGDSVRLRLSVREKNTYRIMSIEKMDALGDRER